MTYALPLISNTCLPNQAVSLVDWLLQVWELTSSGVMMQNATQTCLVPASIGRLAQTNNPASAIMLLYVAC